MIGTLLLAKKTKTHLEFFKNNFEAIFFKNLNDCIKKCHLILKDDKKLNFISSNGTKKVNLILNYISFEKNIKKILSNLF